jgi:argininosuccinate lyase
MPQKKNPITLEHIKGRAGHILALAFSPLAVQRNTPFSHAQDISQGSFLAFRDALGEAEAVLELTRVTVAGLIVRRERMVRQAAEDFSTATELADTLVRRLNLPFRVAHAIVGNAVAKALQRGIRADGMDTRLLDEAAEEVTGRPLGLDARVLADALDPLSIVEGKVSLGSPSPRETESLIRSAREALGAQRERIEGHRRRLMQAEEELARAVEELKG